MHLICARRISRSCNKTATELICRITIVDVICLAGIGGKASLDSTIGYLVSTFNRGYTVYIGGSDRSTGIQDKLCLGLIIEFVGCNDVVAGIKSCTALHLKSWIRHTGGFVPINQGNALAQSEMGAIFNDHRIDVTRDVAGALPRTSIINKTGVIDVLVPGRLYGCTIAAWIGNIKSGTISYIENHYARDFSVWAGYKNRASLFFEKSI